MTKQGQNAKADLKTLFNPDDFRSITLVLELENITTKMEIRDGKRFFGGRSQSLKKNETVTFIEFLEDEGDQGLVLECPPNSGAQGHQVKVKVQSEFRGETIRQEVVGTITEVESLEGKSQRVSVKLTQFDSVAWFQLKDLFASRQREVLELLQRMRGF